MKLLVDRNVTAFVGLSLVGSLALALAFQGIDPFSTLGNVLGLLAMWLPALAALAVKCLGERSLRMDGWRAGPPRYWLAAYIAPLLYGGIPFALAAAIGTGEFNGERLAIGAGNWGLEPTVGNGILLLTTVLILPGLLMALGEEIGWRGYLFPRLVARYGFWSAVNIGAVIWFAFHVPGLAAGLYGPAELPLWWSLALFAGLIWSGSLFYGWLRLKSGSIWPVALAHAAHNTFIQMLFGLGFTSDGTTPYLAGEFGILTVVLMAGTAAILYFRDPPKEVQQHSAQTDEKPTPAWAPTSG